jgi:quercetin dioxygenase-like cupin family protein
VLDGEMEFVVEGATITATAGSFVHIPKGMLRAYKNVGTETARAIVVFAPGGFEGFFEEVGEPATELSSPPVSEPDLERLVAVAAK